MASNPNSPKAFSTPLLVVPVLVFKTEDARALRNANAWLCAKMEFIEVGEWTYLPFEEPIRLSDVINVEQIPFKIERPLLDAGIALPNGAKISCLLIDGRHEFRREAKNGEHPALWYRTVNGLRDAYAFWVNSGGAPLERPIYSERRGERPPTRKVFVSRDAKGAVYAREALLSQKGFVERYLETLVFVELAITVDPRTGRQILRAEVTKRTYHVRLNVDGSPMSSPGRQLLHGLPTALNRLGGYAIEGFDRDCQPHREDSEDRRQFYVDQLSSITRDGPAFHERISRAKTANEALAHVREPWQLGWVVEEFCGGEDFNVVPELTDPESRRIARMIRQFPESRQRKEDLLAMARRMGLID